MTRHFSFDSCINREEGQTGERLLSLEGEQDLEQEMKPGLEARSGNPRQELFPSRRVSG